MRVSRKIRAGLIVLSVATATPLVMAAIRDRAQASIQGADADAAPTAVIPSVEPAELNSSPAITNDSAPTTQVAVTVNGTPIPVKATGSTKTTISDDGGQTNVDVRSTGQGTAKANETSGSGTTRTTTRVSVNSRTRLNNKSSNPAVSGPINLTYSSDSDQSTP